MASSYKTPYLGLNKFVGTDKPKMDDFNFDNTQLDSKIKEHIQSTAHLTAEERIKWNESPFVLGSYTGDGTQSRIISLGFPAKFGMLFTVNQPLQQYVTSGNQNAVYAGYFSSLGCSTGIQNTADGIKVFFVSGNAVDGKRPVFNLSGATYIYVAFA